jgi:hypothetical protein
MNRIFGAALLAAVAQTCLAAAHAQTGSYSSWSAGNLSGMDLEYDISGGDVEIEAGDGGILTYARGWATSNFRAEASLSYSEQNIDVVRRRAGPVIQVFNPPGDVQIWTLASTAYFDFSKSGLIRPYVGFGLGIASVDLNDRIESEAGLAVNARAAAGVRIPLSGQTSLFAELRHDAYLKDIDDGFGFDGNESVLTLGQTSGQLGIKSDF